MLLGIPPITREEEGSTEGCTEEEVEGEEVEVEEEALDQTDGEYDQQITDDGTQLQLWNPSIPQPCQSTWAVRGTAQYLLSTRGLVEGGGVGGGVGSMVSCRGYSYC